MVKYSVIVPAYNCEDTIEECIDSILSQKVDNYEVIVVNDGSTDNTAKLVQEYADSRLRLINQNNQGPYRARTTGIDSAEGEWILFVDSDDVVSSDWLGTIEKNMRDDVDLIGFLEGSFSRKDIGVKESNANIRIYKREEFLDEVVRKTIVKGTESVGMCNRAYKKKLIKQYNKTYEHSFLEDYFFNMCYYMGVNKYVHIDCELYFTRFRANSLSHTVNPKAFEILNEVDATKKEILEEMNITTKEDMIQSSVWYVQYITNFMKRFIFAKGLGVKEVKKILADERLVSRCKELSKAGCSTKVSEYIAGCSTFRALACIIKDNMIYKAKVVVKEKFLNKTMQKRTAKA